MKIIKSDYGGKYTGKELMEFYTKKGIKVQMLHIQNEMVWRNIRTNHWWK